MLVEVFIIPEEQLAVLIDLVPAVVDRAEQEQVGATDIVQLAPDPWSNTQASTWVQLEQLLGAETSA